MLNWTPITSPDELDRLLSRERASSKFVLIFKHSTRCGISSMAKNRLERKPIEGMEYFLIDVLRNRDTSDSLALKFNVKHESPQSFLLKGSELVQVRSHSSIDPAEISEIFSSDS